LATAAAESPGSRAAAPKLPCRADSANATNACNPAIACLVAEFLSANVTTVPGDVDHQILDTGTEPMTLITAFSAAPVTVVFPDGTPIDLPWRS